MKRIPLGHNQFALVDDEEFASINKWKWHARKANHTTYVDSGRRIKGLGIQITVSLHRIIMDLPTGDPREVDHIDGNGLNNQKENLRVCTRLENMRNLKISNSNTSGYKGVSWSQGMVKWKVQIRIGGQINHLGFFTCLIKAAKAYDDAARKHFGEFARLNFPKDGEQGCK